MFKQDQLSYDFAALEPHIDRQTMEIHYGKHHAAYTNNLNAALEKAPAQQGQSIEEILRSLAVIEDQALRTAIRNNGGGYYNHNLYFDILGPNGSNPEGALEARINQDFGNFGKLREKLTTAALTVFGSGWAWLSADPAGQLIVSSTPNQDNPLMVKDSELTPILGIDVWEHAYYLKYQNVRADYVQALFNVINWQAVAARYEKAKK
ncbi:MAG: superoxide dismutase [Firmicutes bacterium]|nr:superoxide dismutase [Bacillota bacterium]